jgi:serine/threonine protein kinase
VRPGTFKGALPSRSFQDAEENQEGENQELFFDFTRSMLCRRPEERKSAKDLLSHAWIHSKL